MFVDTGALPPRFGVHPVAGVSKMHVNACSTSPKWNRHVSGDKTVAGKWEH